MSHDFVEHIEPPSPDEQSLGAKSIRAHDGRMGVRIMLRGFQLFMHDDAPIAYVEMTVPGAVQCVQAIRQAIAEARKGRVRS